MKKRILIFITICILSLCNVSNQKAFAFGCLNPEDSIKVFSSPDLYELTNCWVNEYCAVNHGAKIKVIKTQPSQIDNYLSSKSNLAFISGDYNSSQQKKINWKMIVGVDALVPIINSKNPFVEELNQKGVSPETIAQILSTSEKNNWSQISTGGNKTSFKYYAVKDELIKSNIANFLKVEPAKINGLHVENDEELLSEVQKDPYAMGFCKISSVIDVKNQKLIQGISLLPIDKNGNGKIDYNEKIYEDLNSILRGVWIGKYPKELTNNIYSVSSVKPSSESEIEFLSWILTDGQQYLNKNGYSDLALNLRRNNVDKLSNVDAVVNNSKNTSAIPIVIIFLVSVFVLFFVVESIAQRIKDNKSKVPDASIDASPFFDDSSIVVPDGIYFDKSHTWAFMERDGVVGVGIDDFLQQVTGPITRIKMKESGEKIKKGEPFLTLIQDGKQLIIKAPLSGTIKAQNKNLNSNSSLINKSPYSEGWIYRIEPTNWMRDTQFLIFAQGYKEWLKMEFLHLKDFFAVAVRPDFADKAHVVLQDGGVIRKGILKDLKPEVWEDFQTYFLDSSK